MAESGQILLLVPIESGIEIIFFQILRGGIGKIGDLAKELA